jgi:FtsH-binding integral membrane protein
MSTFTDYSPLSVAQSEPELRAKFIRQTYLHLAGAIGVFALLTAALLHMPFTKPLIGAMAGSQMGWLLVLGLFMGVSWIADKWARSDTSRAMQYVGLGLFIVAQSIVFLPLLYVATFMSGDPTVITQAAILTAGIFFGITGIAFFTKSDFSWLGPIIGISVMVALGTIVCSMLFGFTLGTVFAAVMALVAGAAILYTTSNILHHYRTDQYVAASLALFSAVALLFFYILRILMRR